jgi:CheY-like chemotaxis protein/two-component sensor histidine kinase
LKGGRHLLALINEVLDIARIETGHLDLDLQAVDVDGLLQEALALIAPMASERGIVLHQSAPAPPVHVLADRKRLLQVMLNLMSNAVKYNHPNGSVWLQVQVEAGRARIGVTDNGPGIDASLRARLFTPFDRLGAENRPGEGTGLGLAVSQQMMSAMGGSIDMESTVGQGSTFRVELPCTDAPDQGASAAPASADSRPSMRACTVLYIEDQSSNLALVEILLARRANITLLSTPSGSEGLRMARQHAPDLVLLDLHLPDLGGLEVLSQLRAAEGFGNTPVVVVSADAMPATIERALAAGASAYLTKPLDVSLFFSTLDKYLQ